jgi:pilus assembly protein Flp/PilA
MILKIKKLFVEISEILPDANAVTAMEYGLIAALIAVVVIAGLNSIGGNLEATFVSIASDI